MQHCWCSAVFCSHCYCLTLFEDLPHCKPKHVLVFSAIPLIACYLYHFCTMLFTCLAHFPSLNFAHCFVLLMCCFPPFSRNHMLSIPHSGLKVLKETHYPISLSRGMMGDAALIMWLPAWSSTAFWIEEHTAEQFTSFYISCM